MTSDFGFTTGNISARAWHCASSPWMQMIF
jgi:hypothetical protein